MATILYKLYDFGLETFRITLFLVFLTFSINEISAQSGNGYNGYRGNGSGAEINPMGGAMNQQNHSENPKEIPVEVTVATIIDNMKPALSLDELQAIAISNILTESVKQQGVLLKQKYSHEEQIKNFEALSENMDRKINQFLNKEQKEKYIVFKEEQKNPKKTKEKNKSKKDKEKQKKQE